jgi:hypothetical protein
MCSPYASTIGEFVLRYAVSVERKAILKGLLDYRAALQGIGVSTGFQLLDGSFVEDVENIRLRPPGDIDVVTFAEPATADKAAWRQTIFKNLDLFLPSRTKAKFKCDAYFIDLSKQAETLVEDTAYFFNLFSHQKNTHTWKGMVKVRLVSDDAMARSLL